MGRESVLIIAVALFCLRMGVYGLTSPEPGS